MLMNLLLRFAQFCLFFYMVLRIHNTRILHYRKTGEWVEASVKFDGRTIVRYEAGKPGFLLGEVQNG